MRVIDGMHRLRSAISNGETEIEVMFFDGTEAEAFIRGVAANVTHGLPLSRADRRAAAIRILNADPRLSDRVVAAYTGLSAEVVRTLRRSTGPVAQSDTRVGADGRSRPLNAALGRLRAAEAIAARPDAPLREIAKTAGVAVSTAHDVRTRLLHGQDPVPRRHQAATKASTRGAPETDRAEMLRRLARDPSLRVSQPGRDLLRLLGAQFNTDLSCLSGVVPAHRRTTVAQLARQVAQDWLRLADRLDAR